MPEGRHAVGPSGSTVWAGHERAAGASAGVAVTELLGRATHPNPAAETLVAGERFRRVRLPLEHGGEALADTFPDLPGAACLFVRLPRGAARAVHLIFDGVDEALPCPAGGWLLQRAGVPDAAGEPAGAAPCYWLPQPPASRTLDANGRILTQRDAGTPEFRSDGGRLTLTVEAAADTHLDLTVWRLEPPGTATEALRAPTTLECQRWFLRSSHATVERVADLYRCLVHGWVYDDRFVRRPRFPQRVWRICSENEAYSLYMLMNGLGRATGRGLYTLLKRQIVASLLARQAPDGGWHHGEWTDLMESHFRLHAAGTLVLEADYEEARDPVVRRALDAAAAFLAARTDRTDAGLWFLHDALEESVERATAPGAPAWRPTRMLGAAPSNKLILNSHLDAIVVLDRYRELTGDNRHAAAVESALAAARTMLGARPAEWLYRPAYRALWLTLLPAERTARLPLAQRLLRRAATRYLVPNLHRLKRRWPRFVMPGGLIDRHLAPPFYNTGYHTVNLMDVVRLLRRFPGDDLRRIVRDAVDAVTRTGLLQHWVETRRVQAVGYWVEAIYQVCTLDPAPEYREHLAAAMLAAEQMGIGLPPTLLGSDPESTPLNQQARCPCPADAGLRLASTRCEGRTELLVVNVTPEAIALRWPSGTPWGIQWRAGSGTVAASAPAGTGPILPPRGWLAGQAFPQAGM